VRYHGFDEFGRGAGIKGGRAGGEEQLRLKSRTTRRPSSRPQRCSGQGTRDRAPGNASIKALAEAFQGPRPHNRRWLARFQSSWSAGGQRALGDSSIFDGQPLWRRRCQGRSRGSARRIPTPGVWATSRRQLGIGWLAAPQRAAERTVDQACTATAPKAGRRNEFKLAEQAPQGLPSTPMCIRLAARLPLGDRTDNP